MEKVKNNSDFNKLLKEDWLSILPNEINQYVKTTIEGINIQPLYDQTNQPLLNTISLSNPIEIHENEIENDPISNIVKKFLDRIESKTSGEIFSEELKQLQSKNEITFSSASFHEIGANHVQEISYLLAAISEMLHQTKENNGDISKILQSVQFELSVDTDFYMSIAKIKAFQLLIPFLLEKFTENIYFSNIIYILKTSKRTLTNEEETLNLVRKTIETIASFLSGVDFVRIIPYENNEEAARWTNNIYNLLKYESDLSNYRTLLNGSYYIENLTKQVAEKAWDHFLDIEEKGGFFHFIDSGKLFEEIKIINKNRLRALMLGDKKIVGSNAFRRVEPSINQSYSNDIIRDSEWIEKCHLLSSTSWDCIILDGATENEQTTMSEILKTLSSIGLKNEADANIIFLAGRQDAIQQYSKQNKDKIMILVGETYDCIPYSILRLTELPDAIDSIYREKGWS